MKQKLAALEKKILIGGENLLEKAEEQEKLLEAARMELEERRSQESILRKQIQEKEVIKRRLFSRKNPLFLFFRIVYNKIVVFPFQQC